VVTTVILMSKDKNGQCKLDKLDTTYHWRIAMVKLIEIKKSIRGSSTALSELYVNPDHIVSVSEDIIANETLLHEAKNLGLVEGVRFSKVVISEGNHPRTLTIVGSPTEIYNKIRKRQVLRG